MLYERHQLNATSTKRFQATSFKSFTDKFRSPFDENRLWIGCSMKGTEHCFFRRVSANIRLVEDVLKTSRRHLQDVFSVTFFCLPRRPEDIIARRLANTSWKRLEDVLQTSWKTSCKRLEDVLKTSWRHHEGILGRRIANTSWRRLQDVFKRSWKTKSFTLKTSSRCLQDVSENKKCLLGWFKTVTFGNAYWEDPLTSGASCSKILFLFISFCNTSSTKVVYRCSFERAV